MALTGLSGYVPTQSLHAEAATSYKFDFGAGGTASGCTGVSASTSYSAALGYGFADTTGVKNVSAAGSDALSDAVQFTSTDKGNTFNVDLPNGLYRVTVTLGNTTRTSIRAEDVLQIINMTGNNATDSILIPITDGQLNIMATEGKAGYAFTLSELDIEWVSDATELPATIWMCGDSTVCNYYPLATSTQAGWGQVLSQYVDSSKWQVRNLAASGQYAKGFVDAGQFDAVLKYGKEGDMYIISIGINDTNYSNADEYTETVTSMVQQAKAKGMQVVLVKQQGRASDVTNHPTLTGRWFSSQLEAIGTAEDVQVIDLFNPWLQFCLSIGQEETYNYYMTDDDLHPNRQGAMKLAEFAVSQIDWEGSSISEEGAVLDESITFMLRNGSSGLYLSLEAEAAQGTNAVQLEAQGIDTGKSCWKAVAAGDGYYRLYSMAGDGSYLLDVTGNKSANGTNVGIWGNSGSDAQLFKFIAQDDGSYVIATKSASDASAVEVVNASDESGANVQEWERNSHPCQTWFIERTVSSSGDVILGDVNGDNVVDAFDIAALKYLLRCGSMTHTQRRAADVNGDAGVDTEDLQLLTDFVLARGTFADAESGAAVYYAVDAAYNRGYEESTNAGFTSDAYLNLDNVTGSFVEFTVTVPEDGNYLCTFKIANGSTNNRSMKIEVNQGTDYWMQDFLSTGSWTTWMERGIVLPLTAGTNLIRLTSATGDGGPNIDYLRTELTEEPIAEVYVPEEEPEESQSGTTIYIAGDSTVQTYRASYAPQQGWGAYLGDYFTDDVTVSNHAIAGRSSKSFYDNGRLDTILDEIQEGDYLLVQFGINDSAYNNEERYAPVCGSVPGTDGSFEYYIAKYIEGAKEKGATPVLVTTVLGLKAYNSTTGKFEGSYSNYCNAMKQLAAYYDVPCIDLNALMVEHYNEIGYDAAYQYHLISTELSDTDMTHFTETGANAVAGLVAEAIRNLDLPVSSKVK
jgi:lysophospholipase L1-like esterase